MKKHEVSANWVHTWRVEEPVGQFSAVGEHWKELGIALEQGLVPTAESKDTTKRLFLRFWIVQVPGKVEAHFGTRQLIHIYKGLPERGGSETGDGFKAETHDAVVGGAENVASRLTDQQPRLGPNRETAHFHGVFGDITGDGTGGISDRRLEWMTGGILDDLVGTRSGFVESCGVFGASGAPVTWDPQVRRARVENDIETLGTGRKSELER